MELIPCFCCGYICPVLFFVPKNTGKERRILGTITDNLISNKENIINSYSKVILPNSILGDNRLTFLERLVLIVIISLSKKEGYCWATNEYFKNLFGVSKQTISKSISSLSKYGYIVLKYDKKEKNNSKRVIRLSEVLKNQISGIKNNLNTSNQDNLKQYNNKNNIKRNNIGPIISKDVDGVELWNGKRVESEPMSEDEQKYLESLLSCFRTGDE